MSTSSFFKHTILFIVLWVGLTMLTHSDRLPVDGPIYIGFPFTFYMGYQPECENCEFTEHYYYLKLAIDLLLALMVYALAVLAVKKVVHNKSMA